MEHTEYVVLEILSFSREVTRNSEDECIIGEAEVISPFQSVPFHKITIAELPFVNKWNVENVS